MKEATEIIFVLDKSNSMDFCQDKTRELFSKFLTDQKQMSGDASLSLIQFNENYEPNYFNKNLPDVEFLTPATYKPSGVTSLLDAVGRTIDDAGKKFGEMKEEDRPNKVLFVILTDGLENNSKDYTRDKVREMIELQTNNYKWEFIFIGANIDSFAEGMSFGISKDNILNFSQDDLGMDRITKTMSSYSMSYRKGEHKTLAQIAKEEDYEDPRSGG